MRTITTDFGSTLDLSLRDGVSEAKVEFRVNGIVTLVLSERDAFALSEALDTYGEMAVAANREKNAKRGGSS